MGGSWTVRAETVLLSGLAFQKTVPLIASWLRDSGILQCDLVCILQDLMYSLLSTAYVGSKFGLSGTLPPRMRQDRSLHDK